MGQRGRRHWRRKRAAEPAPCRRLEVLVRGHGAALNDADILPEGARLVLRLNPNSYGLRESQKARATKRLPSHRLSGGRRPTWTRQCLA
eukprot:3954088-Pyramimonas_sp.AAC.1